MFVPRLLTFLLISSSLTLTACSGNGSSTSSNNNQTNNSDQSGDNSDNGNGNGNGNNDNGDNGNGDNGNGDNGNGDNGNGDNGNGDNGGSGENPGSGDNGGNGPLNPSLGDGCNYTTPEPMSLPELFGLSLQDDTYTLKDGQELTSANENIAGTWLAVHGIDKTTLSNIKQDTDRVQSRSVFVVRKNAEGYEYANCAAQVDGQISNTGFKSLSGNNINETISLSLLDLLDSHEFTINSFTQMNGKQPAGSDTIRERVTYKNQLSRAIKISDSTDSLGQLSLSSDDLAADHNNQPVYCFRITRQTKGLQECKSNRISRSSDSGVVFGSIDSDTNTNIYARLLVTGDSSNIGASYSLVYRKSGDIARAIVESRFTELPNNGSPNSSTNLTTATTTKFTFSSDVQGINLPANNNKSATIAVDLTIPLQIP